MATNNGRLEQMSMLKPLMAKPVEKKCGHQLAPGFPECTLPKGHADKWHRHQKKGGAECTSL